MHDLYSESNLRASFVNVQLNEMNRLPSAVDVGASAVRNGLTLNFDADHNARRSRVVSLSDLALEAMSPVYSNINIDGVRTGAHTMMTPTPTQFLFPRSVTAEQEAYASGFALALEEIYRKNGDLPEGRKGFPGDERVNSNDFVPNTYNCTLWQPTAMTHASTLHYIPESSVSSAPSCLVGGQPGAPRSHWGAKLDYNTTLVQGYQPLPTLLAGPSVDVTSLTFGIPPVRDSQYPTSNVLQDSTMSGNCINSRDFKDFSGALNYIPTTSSLAVSCFSDITTSMLRVQAEHSSMPMQLLSVTSTNNSSPQLPTNSSEQLLFSDSSNSTVTTTAPSIPLSVDMQQQDRWRLERKRAKNRVAAARCQTRKLERITKLENKAQELRNYNAQLSQTAALLHEQVTKLQKQILSHTERGCRLLIPAL